MGLVLSDARKLVLARLGVASGESDLADLVDIQLNIEYQTLVLEHQLVVEVADLITTEGEVLVDLPDDLVVILRLLWDGDKLEPKTWIEFSDALSDNSTDLFYVQSGVNQIRLSVEPDADAEDITCWYAQEAPAWDDDIDEPSALPAAFHLLPVERAVEWLALVEEEQGLAQVAKARGDALESRLVRHLGRRMGEGNDVISPKGLS